MSVSTYLEKFNFYLGLFKHISDKYRYKWVKNIIYEYTGKIITNNQKKNYIPKKLKIDIWNKYIGHDKRNTKCINLRDFLIFIGLYNILLGISLFLMRITKFLIYLLIYY